MTNEIIIYVRMKTNVFGILRYRWMAQQEQFHLQYIFHHLPNLEYPNTTCANILLSLKCIWADLPPLHTKHKRYWPQYSHPVSSYLISRYWYLKSEKNPFGQHRYPRMSSRNQQYDYAWLQRVGKFDEFQHRSDNKMSPKAESLYFDKSLPPNIYNPYGPYSNSQRTVATSHFFNPKDKQKYNDSQLGLSSWPVREHIHDASRPNHHLKHHPMENSGFMHNSSYLNFQNSLNRFPGEGRLHQNQLSKSCTLNDQQVMGGCYGDNGLMFNKESCVAIDVNAKQNLSNQQQNIHFANNNTTMQVSSCFWVYCMIAL